MTFLREEMDSFISKACHLVPPSENEVSSEQLVAIFEQLGYKFLAASRVSLEDSGIEYNI